MSAKRYTSFLRWMYMPVDSASMVVFRIGFGSIMMWEVWRYFDHNWIKSYYTGKTLYFTYPGFSWVHPWPTLELMEAHFLLIALFGAMVAMGLCYRLAATGLFFAFSYVFLLEQARYLNHFYFVILVAFTMIFVPANRSCSFDRLIKSYFAKWPFVRDASNTFMDTWAVWAVKMQFGITYFYGGIAKLNADWLRGYPLSDWIYDNTTTPIIGPYVHERWMGLFLSYSGLVLDLAFVPLLLWRKKRWFGLLCALAFNLMNDQLFSIGIFPWMMIIGTTLFMEPDWPKRFWDFCTMDKATRLKSSMQRTSARVKRSKLLSKITIEQHVVAVVMITFFVFQFLFPFRHILYTGNVSWTEEGHMYSWHMKLRSKSGRIRFVIKDADTGRMFEVDPGDFLNGRQERKMDTRPDMILQFAHWLRDYYQEQGMENVEVYAESFASLNGRAEQRLIDPSVNLADVQWNLGHSTWIVPLTARRY